MTGILVLAHGSKREETDRILQSILKMVRQKVSDTIVQAAYLQFSEKDLHWGVQSLVQQGVKHIKVVPFFIFDGVHVTEDIPNELLEIGKQFPDVTLTMTSHLGDDERLADIIVDRILGE
ncbi:MAG: CbiX/SirB N-terminal domain-containing protein [Hyphomonadaceae bacterium]|nr:CbiX/SirB N-terminal domain-containing protein [Clostridia bacterium]